MAGEPEAIERLVQATNQHDLEALVACFSEDYENITPAHPHRGFRGRSQVRRNWEQIFQFVPDLVAEVTDRAVVDNRVWTEWSMRGTRRDGTSHEMCGVIVFRVNDGLIDHARFYLEPVDAGAATVNDAVRAQVVR